MEYPKVCLRKGDNSKIGVSGLWVFDNQIDWYDDSCEEGGIVDVIGSDFKFCCRGFFNSGSKIVVRILSFDDSEEINDNFFRRKIQIADSLRRNMGFSDSYRIFFGESDGISGLTIDKYGDYLSFQLSCLGLERRKTALINILAELFHPKGIMERDDIPSRVPEGLSLLSGTVYGTVPNEIVIREHDALLYADLLNGQKTGHFLDQQENRGRIKPYVKGRSVLDLCCCTGGFSVHASLYGAESVLSVDVSEAALNAVMKNAALNGCKNISVKQADVFELLSEYADRGEKFGTVILDPPAFAKSKKVLEQAYRGYKRANALAMKLVESGGFLLTFSCSKFMTPELFMKMLREAAAESGRNVRHLERMIQSRDHSASVLGDNSLYLKGEILQIL